QAWDAHFVRTLMVRIGGESVDEVNENGERIADETFLFLLNAAEHAMTFVLPAHRPGVVWERVFDTGEKTWRESMPISHDRYRLRPRSLALVRTRSRVNGADNPRTTTTRDGAAERQPA